MAAGGAADARGVEAGAFNENVGGIFGDARIQAAEHAADTHGFDSVANHQVGAVEGALHSVECHEFRALLNRAHHDFSTLNRVEVEAVERLADAVEDIVGDVYNIVDASDADCFEALAQPVGALFHFNATDCHSAVAWRTLGIDNLHAGCAVGAVGFEADDRRAMQLFVGQVAVAICSQVACNPVVACCIDAVGC